MQLLMNSNTKQLSIVYYVRHKTHPIYLCNSNDDKKYVFKRKDEMGGNTEIAMFKEGHIAMRAIADTLNPKKTTSSVIKNDDYTLHCVCI